MTERKHLVVVAGKMIELGLQEREVRLAEQ
jgi:hypothetical protein